MLMLPAMICRTKKWALEDLFGTFPGNGSKLSACEINYIQHSKTDRVAKTLYKGWKNADGKL